MKNSLLCMPKRWIVLALFLLIFIGCAFQAGSTYSWFFFSAKQEVTLQAGLVRYEPQNLVSGSSRPEADSTYGSFIPDTDEKKDDTYIYPGKQLIAPTSGGATTLNTLKLQNFSTIDSNVRVRVSGQIVTNFGQPGATTEPAICVPKGDGTGSNVGDTYWLGVNVEASGSQKVLPLLEMTFGRDTGSGTGAGSGYHWKLSSPVRKGAFEWELVQGGQNVSQASISPPTGNNASTVYQTLTSVMVVKALTPEQEILFTDRYSGQRLLLKVEYLAKQHDAMDWIVFYENQLAY